MFTNMAPATKYWTGRLMAIACVIVVVVAFIMILDSNGRQEEAKRQSVAAHWQEAGLKNAVTTLKQDENKSTTGIVGTCTVTVEGHTSYTSVTIATTQGRWMMQEVRFTSEGENPRSADIAAFDFIENIPAALSDYCSVG